MSALPVISIAAPWLAGEGALADRLRGWLDAEGVEFAGREAGTWLLAARDADAVDALLDGGDTRPVSGTLVIDATPAPVARLRARAAALAERGVDWIDLALIAAGTGPAGALACGGAQRTFDRARPLLEALVRGSAKSEGVAPPLLRVGEAGASRVALDGHRVIVAGTAQAVAEALALTRALHADTGRVAAAMAGGFAASQVLADLGPDAGGRADGGPERIGPSVDEGAGALGAVLDDAHALGCALPLTALVAQQLNALAGAGLGQSDLAALGELLARMRAPETPA